MAGQNAGTPNIVVSAILVLVGLYYVLAPHELHVSSGFGFGLDHPVHMVLGVILLAAGAGYYMTKTAKGKK
ncbi:MAG: hypothetical protein HY516_01160 [Candidatus Aenigmarchaeota archaeon]|nr:hypothetical protein [Candidatus Aenigmarchaeota archaeon]